MKYLTPLVLAVMLFVVPNALAEMRRVTLQDGTELVGELVALKNGAYTIRTKNLGTLTVSEGQVASISSMGAPKVSQPSRPALSSQVEGIQQSLLNDTGMLQSIMQLQSNPDMQAVLSDPEVMAAIQNFDLETLKNHPKIKRLMQNQEIKSISAHE